jgi:hypothetical protein
MKDIKEPSGSGHAHLQIIPDPDSNPTAAIQALFLPLIQTLNQNDRGDVTSLVKSIITTIARHRRALNDTNSPLLRLPTELLVEIGYQVMRTKPARFPPVMPGCLGRRMRTNWRIAIGNFMNTSSRLRQEVNLVPLAGVTLRYHQVHSSCSVKRCREIRRDIEYYCGTLQRRPLAIYMYLSRESYACGSGAAAFAAFVERAVFGSLQNPPVVYAQTRYDSERSTAIFISHARVLGVRRLRHSMAGRWYEGLVLAGETRERWKKL